MILPGPANSCSCVVSIICKANQGLVAVATFPEGQGHHGLTPFAATRQTEDFECSILLRIVPCLGRGILESCYFLWILDIYLFKGAQ